MINFSLRFLTYSQIFLFVISQQYQTLIKYNFLESECLNNSFKDKIKTNYFGDIRRSTTSTCLPSNGVITKSSSTSSSSIFSQTLNPNGFATEMWLQINTTQTYNIFSFSKACNYAFPSIVINLSGTLNSAIHGNITILFTYLLSILSLTIFLL